MLNNAPRDDGQQNRCDEELFPNREGKHQTFFLFAPNHTWADADVQRLMNDTPGRFSLRWVRVFLATVCGILLPATSLAAGNKPATLDEQFVADMKAAQLAQNQAQTAASAAEMGRIREIYGALIAKYPQSADPHASFGEFLANIGQNDEALLQWNEALKIDPSRADIYAAESGVILQAGDTVGATRLMELAVEKAPADASYHFALAHLYFLFRQDLFPIHKTTEAAMFALALDHFRKAAELAPTNANYARAYAETFFSIPDADWNAALDAWRNVMVLSNEPSFVHAQMVRVCLRLKDKSGAIRHLDQVTDPQFGTLKKTLQRQIDAL